MIESLQVPLPVPASAQDGEVKMVRMASDRWSQSQT